VIQPKRFQLLLVMSQAAAFDFERASLALLARHQHRGATAVSLPAGGEWRNLATLRANTNVRQGVHHHG